VDLGTLGGASAFAVGINAGGSVVGNSATATGANYAFLYTDGGGMIDLGTLPGNTGSGAAGINALGVIVGGVSNAAGVQRAFVYRPGAGMADLNDLIGPGTGWTLIDARGINDAGQIVGTGVLASGSGFRAYLLTPVPEPSALLLAGGAAVAVRVLSAARRNRPGVVGGPMRQR
jgi:probable HAF family extracellular repeat protein